MTDPASLLTFPCLFPLTIIGVNEKGFQTSVTSIVRRHVPDMDEDRFHLRQSSQGNYISVRIVFWAESREQVDNLYRELSTHPQVKMLL
jgi:putative lipoic acid-binding regulatory protein